MPARAIDTASISFGLVNIPVKIYSTNEPSQELHFHMVHEGCGQRLHQRYVCPDHGEVERSDIIKGFELAKGNVVELTKAELKALEAVASDEIAMAEFVPATEVDPLYIEHSYYLAPAKGGERAFRLFRDALDHAGLAGIAAYAARGKQYVVMLRPYQDGLVMHQLRYPDEIKPWSEVPLGKLPKAAPAELGLAAKVIDSLTHETFDPGQYSDEVKGRVRKLIANKAKGGEIVVPEGAPKPAVTDLMAALKASLAGEAAAARPNGSNGSNGKRTGNGKRATRAGKSAKTATGRRVHRPARGEAAAPRKQAAASRKGRAHRARSTSHRPAAATRSRTSARHGRAARAER